MQEKKENIKIGSDYAIDNEVKQLNGQTMRGGIIAETTYKSLVAQ